MDDIKWNDDMWKKHLRESVAKSSLWIKASKAQCLVQVVDRRELQSERSQKNSNEKLFCAVTINTIIGLYLENQRNAQANDIKQKKVRSK